jgi:hypothetical protein
MLSGNEELDASIWIRKFDFDKTANEKNRGSEIRFLRAVAGYRMIYYKYRHVTGELGATDISIRKISRHIRADALFLLTKY